MTDEQALAFVLVFSVVFSFVGAWCYRMARKGPFKHSQRVDRYRSSMRDFSSDRSST